MTEYEMMKDIVAMKQQQETIMQSLSQLYEIIEHNIKTGKLGEPKTAEKK